MIRLVQRIWRRFQGLVRAGCRSDGDGEAMSAQAEQRLADLVSDMDVIIWIASAPFGELVHVSGLAEKALGFPLNRWLDEPGFRASRIHPDDREAVGAHFAAALGQGRGYEAEYRMLAADGRSVWFRDRVHVVADAEGRPVRLRGYMMDITDRKRTELELEESRAQYRSVVDNVKQVIFQTDARGRWTLLNPAWTDLTGLSVEETLGRSFLDFLHPEDRQRQAGLFLPLVGGGALYFGQEIRYLTKAGGFRWVEALSCLAVDDRDRVVGTYGTLTDITERKVAEEEVLKTRERLRHLLASSPAVIYSREVADHFALTFVSENIRTLSGYAADEVMQAPELWTRMVHPADAPRVPDTAERIGEGGAESREYRLVLKDGRSCWVRDEWRAVRDTSGRVVEIVGSLVDITERRRGEEERARLSSAVEEAGESIIITDPKGTIVYVNPAYEKLSGYGRSELVGRNPRLLKSGQHPPEFYEALWATLARGERWSGSFVNVRKDGAKYEEVGTIFAVLDATGHVANYVGVMRDVTSENRMKEELRQSQKMEAVGRLAGGVAHDFNNLLTVITGRCELMVHRLGRSHKLSQELELILTTAHRAAALTRQLLAFSHKHVLATQVLDLNSVVVNMQRMLHRLIGEDIELVTTLDPALGCVHADQGQMEQVILNLVLNSRDAMPQGGRLSIETANAESQAWPPGTGAGPCVVLTVSDNGCGMDAETRSRVFEPFFTTKGVDRGTGLGLSTVYGIVKQGGGQISVESEPGKGARFSIYLQRVEAPRPAAPAPAGVRLRRGQGTVLLVEDDPAVRSLSREILEMSGYLVLEAADGTEALRIGAQHSGRIELAITDVVMPHMGGRHVVERLRSLRPETRILYMSGYTDDTVLRHGVAKAEAAFLQKPFTADALTRKVQEVLEEPPMVAARVAGA
jgi:two-component system cell cycle sensor histidine kinase/response regulator CckA